MRGFSSALFAEYLKIRRSNVLWITIGALCLAPLFGAVFVVILRSPELAAGNEVLRVKAAATGFTPDWAGFLRLLSQAVGVGGIVVFGFIGSWVFGREHSDRTMKDLLTLPVSRGTIVAAKSVAVALWCLLVVVSVVAVALVLGLSLGLDALDGAVLGAGLGRIVITFLLVVALCPPVFWMACVGRGYLAPVGFVIGMLVVAQILGALGLGDWFPWSVPALFSGVGPQTDRGPGMTGFAVLVLVGLAGYLATVWWWRQADHS